MIHNRHRIFCFYYNIRRYLYCDIVKDFCCFVVERTICLALEENERAMHFLMKMSFVVSAD